MNILLTSVGRRNYLVQYFRKALGDRGSVLAADVDPTAPGLTEADEAYVIPRFDAPEYTQALIDLTKRLKVRLLIPLNDYEIPVLARNADRFGDTGTLVVVPTAKKVEIALDKWNMFRALCNWGVPTPRTVLGLEGALQVLGDGALRMPVVVKPRSGSGSMHIRIVESVDELRWACEDAGFGRPENAVVQERIEGIEYGLDVVNNLTGIYECTLAKRKLGMRAGETDRAITVIDDGLERIGKRLGERLQHLGCLDVDVLVTEQESFVIDMNPRFGGGYPFSHLAGADIPAAYVAWAEGKPPRKEWLRVIPDVLGAKCDRMVAIRKEETWNTQ